MRPTAFALPVCLLPLLACGGLFSSGPTFDDSAQGCDDLIMDVQVSLLLGDVDRLDEVQETLLLPDPEGFFTDTFGPELGAKLLADYNASEAPLIGQGFTGMVAQEYLAGRTLIMPSYVTTTGDANATGLQNDLLAQAKTPLALCSMKMTGTGEVFGFHLWSFVHVDGTWRYVGKLKAARTRESSGDADMDMLLDEVSYNDFQAMMAGM